MPQVTFQQAMEQAIQHHQAGRLRDAESIYRQILSQQPNQPDALNLLGVLAFQVQQFAVAADLMTRAVAANPAAPDHHYNLAQALAALGRLPEAVAAYRKALELRHDHVQAWNNLGTTLHLMGQNSEALAALRNAVRLQPGYAQAYYNLGNILLASRDPQEAITSFRQAIAAQPNFAEAWNNLGNALRELGQSDEAIIAYRRACESNPNHPEAHSNLGCLLQERGELEEAMTMINKSLSLQPDAPGALHNMGNLLLARDEVDQAVATFQRVSALQPNFAEGFNGLGYSLREKGQIEESIAAYRQALVVDPNNPRAHHNLGITLLLQGDYAQGWPEYEWRFAANEPTAQALRFTQPRWAGGDLSGQTILIHAEQGFGDTLQFSRYVPMVAERGGRVLFQCHPELARLMRGSISSAEVISRDDPPPEFDVQCPLLSLPMVFKTDLATIPASVPYLRPDHEAVIRWRSRLPAGGLKIGIVWAGRRITREYTRRSLNFVELSPLWEIPNAKFISLQTGDAALQLRENPSMTLQDFTSELHDFADSAALVANLDLIITVDTAVAHLAGAMGKPVWTLIQYVPDWRWLRDRNDTPWYPTMRLFRQTERGNWAQVIGRIADALRGFDSSKGAGADAS